MVSHPALRFFSYREARAIGVVVCIFIISCQLLEYCSVEIYYQIISKKGKSPQYQEPALFLEPTRMVTNTENRCRLYSNGFGAKTVLCLNNFYLQQDKRCLKISISPSFVFATKIFFTLFFFDVMNGAKLNGLTEMRAFSRKGIQKRTS